jgi:hypothetical protein
MSKPYPHESLSCSFCGKSQREVRKLIAGPTVCICDECIGLCNDILAAEASPAADEATRPGADPSPEVARASRRVHLALAVDFALDVASMLEDELRERVRPGEPPDLADAEAHEALAMLRCVLDRVRAIVPSVESNGERQSAAKVQGTPEHG